jgi:tRNA(Met) C34 N-acetyltransferase TmcA
MEKNIRSKIQDHNKDFKENLTQWLHSMNATIQVGDEVKTNEFLQYMSDFPDLELDKIDFQKRKRIKNNVPDYNRCIALKCNGERCSRKQKNESVSFCGTHLKGANYGTTQQQEEKRKVEKIQLWLQEINGIMRYIDNSFNVYCMEDILNQVEQPRIIGTYSLRADKSYYMNQN